MATILIIGAIALIVWLSTRETSGNVKRITDTTTGNAQNRREPSTPAINIDKVRQYFKAERFKDNWQWPAVIVGCEVFFLSVCHLWHWLWSALGLWVLALHIAVILAFLFCREDDKKNKDGGKNFTGAGKFLIASVIVTCMVSWMLGVWSLPTPPSATKLPHISLFGGSAPQEDRKEKKLRDFLDRNKTDNPEVLTRLIRTAEMWPSMIGPRSQVVNVPATGLSEKIPIGKTPMRIRPSEDMILVDDHGREYPVSVINPNWDFPHFTEWVRYRSVMGKPAIVLVSP